MSRTFVKFASPAVSLAAAFLAQSALGAEPEPVHGGHAALQPMASFNEGIVVGISAIVVFLIVLVVLSVKVWPVIVKGLDDRATKIRSSIEEAEDAQRQAKAALAQYEKNLAQARAEAQKMLDDAKQQQQVIAAELKAKSEAELAVMRDKAKRDIDAAKSAAIADIHAHATSLATSMAAKILKREITAGDQKKMIQESLQEMGAGRA